MDINKENTKYLASLLSNCGATQDEINDLSFDDEVGFFESNRLADWFVSQINFGWRVWQAAKAQAVPEGFVLVDKHQLAQLMANMDSFGKKALGDDYVSFADIAEVLDEAREPAND